MDTMENTTQPAIPATVTTDEIASKIEHLRAVLELASNLMVHSLRTADNRDYAIGKRDGDSLVSLLAVSETYADRLLRRIERRAGE